ncbi:twitching motility protein [Flexistipes sinusarabici DSM 4947]|uniref:Twitching motility protein n=1 Tax=Flexistipes sinusarabici (strain ATCC 49648 / DSM 4947 / MAS 10) TaxID=717231 RepID=F8E713_FLESM|nr:type IV pilus twitching motility protein PilT [Flexistipes sinusarabici]AEI14876.1 twitching motility protein [Flexistipes sinusarabici DSM 4947]
MYSLQELLQKMIDMGATDLHLTVGSSPVYRVNGMLVRTEGEALSVNDTKKMCYSIMTEAQKKTFEEEMELDLSFGIKGLSRFRANFFMQRGAMAAAMRRIPYQVMSFEQLGVPKIVESLCEKSRGLVLVTGPTGSGKSTTLASMIDKINHEKKVHIITVEDPIEYLHNHDKALINQREVNSDTKSFAKALKYILRQDPDVALIGEMRDLETIEAALTVSETGHLTFGTLHTNSAVQTINRIIDVFPPHQQPQIRAQLSFVLEGVICQQLLQTSDGNSRVLACEVLVPNSGIRNLIREDKLHQIYSMMQSGQAEHGMITMTQSLYALYRKNLISYEEAVNRAVYPDEVRQLIERGNVVNKKKSGRF